MLDCHEVPGFYRVRGHAHNDYLMFAVSAGLPGLAMAITLAASIWRFLWLQWRKGLKSYWIALAGLGSHAAIAVAGFTQVHQTDHEVETVLYLVLGCGLALGSMDHSDPKMENTSIVHRVV